MSGRVLNGKVLQLPAPQQRAGRTMHFLSSWDESSSISSGLSDGSDNLSSEEFNTSPTLNSLPTTPIGSRRNSSIVKYGAICSRAPGSVSRENQGTSLSSTSSCWSHSNHYPP